MQGFFGQQEDQRGRGAELHPLHQPNQLQDQERGGPPSEGWTVSHIHEVSV